MLVELVAIPLAVFVLVVREPLEAVLERLLGARTARCAQVATATEASAKFAARAAADADHIVESLVIEG